MPGAVHLLYIIWHKSRMLFAMSRDRGEGVFNAKSSANRSEVFDRPTSPKTAYVTEAKSKMKFRVGSGNP